MPDAENSAALLGRILRASGAKEDVVEKADTAARLLMAQGEQQGLTPVQAANRIALVQQSLDATSGLIGNAIVACWGGESRRR